MDGWMEFGRLESPLVVGSYLDEALGSLLRCNKRGGRLKAAGRGGRCLSMQGREGGLSI
jgi:hypothetical protein